jgi:hypothetical protein
MNVDIIPKVIQAYIAGFQLNSIYNSISFRSFEEAYVKRNGNMTTESVETFYNEWLRISDRNLDNELKSSNFTSLLAQYVNVLVELLSKGLDVYLLDWGYPGWEDSSLSLTDYVNYVRDAIQDIKDKTGKNKVSILGYCW